MIRINVGLFMEKPLDIFPKHIAVIPDGNRRWAKSKGFSIRDGYEAGARKAEDLLDWSIIKHDIPQITLYALSTENIDKRSFDELLILVEIYEKHFLTLANDERVHNNKIKLNFFGELALLPDRLLKAITYAANETKNYSEHEINFLMPYGGRWEIITALKKVLGESIDLNHIDEDTFSKHLVVRGFDPDLVIRTAERRLSNFLLWQTAYSEIFFVDKYWPEFTFNDFENILEEFSTRKRRFGQ